MKKILTLLFSIAFAICTKAQSDTTHSFIQEYTPTTGIPVTIRYKIRVFKYAGQVNYRVYIESVAPRSNTFLYEGRRYSNADLGGSYLEKINYANVKSGTLEYRFSFFNQLQSTITQNGTYKFASMSLDGFSGDGAKIWSKEEMGNAEYERLHAKNVSVSTRIIELGVDNSPVVSRIRSLASNEKELKGLLEKAYDQYTDKKLDAALATIKQAEKICDDCALTGNINSLRSNIETAISNKEKKENTTEEQDKKDSSEDNKEKSSTKSTQKTATEKKTEESSSTSSSFDKNLYYACLSLSNAVMQKVQYARDHRTDARAWRDAQTAINNFNCQYAGISQDVIDEVNRNVTATTISDFATSSYDYFTSCPWTYGYGQFFDATNKTYIHRFILGLNGEYSEKFADISFSVNCNLMRLPSRQLSYRFESSNSSIKWNSTKVKPVDNVNAFMLALGSAITIWPHKNFFMAATPELMLGFTHGTDVPTGMFSYAPALNTQAGFRFGKVYLSGNYGMFALKLTADAQKYGGSEAGTIQTAQYGTINGNWLADKFDDGKAVTHKYWAISLGLNL